MKRNALLTLTLLLFAATTALLGIFGSIRSASVFSPQTEEVFAQIPEEPVAETSVPEIFYGFISPLKGTVTSAYGYRNDPFTGERSFHRGIDVASPEGTPVLAAYGGTVTQSDYDPTGGNYVILSHRDGTTSYYGHLKIRFVARGDRVEQGETLGLSGATGRVTGAHLHFQLNRGDQTYDPLRFLNPEA